MNTTEPEADAPIGDLDVLRMALLHVQWLIDIADVDDSLRNREIKRVIGAALGATVGAP